MVAVCDECRLALAEDDPILESGLRVVKVVTGLHTPGAGTCFCCDTAHVNVPYVECVDEG